MSSGLWHRTVKWDLIITVQTSTTEHLFNVEADLNPLLFQHFLFICWFDGLSVKDNSGLSVFQSLFQNYRIKETCVPSGRIGWWRRQSALSANLTMFCGSGFRVMPSGSCYYAPLRRTDRDSNSCTPSALSVLYYMSTSLFMYFSLILFNLSLSSLKWLQRTFCLCWF